MPRKGASEEQQVEAGTRVAEVCRKEDGSESGHVLHLAKTVWRVEPDRVAGVVALAGERAARLTTRDRLNLCALRLPAGRSRKIRSAISREEVCWSFHSTNGTSSR